VGRLEAQITSVDARHVICEVAYHLEGDGSGAPTSYRSVDVHRVESGRLCHSVIGLASTAVASELVPLG